MRIVVCIKRVPEAADAVLKIDSSGKRLLEDTLTFGPNETDTYAVEQGLLVKEKAGGTVTLVTVGPQAAEEILRMGLAKGADEAVRIAVADLGELDPFATAWLLAGEVRNLAPDLVLTGCVASDDGSAQVGVSLAELLGFPHLSLVVGMEVGADGQVVARRELEGGLQEEFRVRLPAVFTVQSGINEPRYASILGIKRAASKPIRVVQPAGEESRMWQLRSLAFPPAGKRAEIIQGSASEVAEQLVSVLKGRALL